MTSRYILGAPLPRVNHYYNYFNMNSHVAAGIGSKTVFESRYECFHLLEVTGRSGPGHRPANVEHLEAGGADRHRPPPGPLLITVSHSLGTWRGAQHT